MKKILLIIAPLLIPSIGFPQEICGLQNVSYNNVFKNGFEQLIAAASAKELKVKSNASKSAQPDLGAPMGMAPIPNGGTPTITITSPAANGILVGRKLQIRGTITGPINTGVSVNGVAAYVQGNQFSTSILTLPSTGAIAITALAKTLDGAVANATRMMSAGPENGVVFTSAKPAEYTNRPVSFNLSVQPSIVIQQVSVDFNGDGIAEFTGSNPSLIPSSYTYAQPGVFSAEATVVTAPPNSQTFTSKAIIAAIDIVDHRIRVCSVYGTLRQRLTANDVAGAIRVFPQENRPQYEALFNALGTNRPVFATRMGTIATGLLTLTDANMTVITNSAGTTSAYKVRFAQGADGVWRIEDM